MLTVGICDDCAEQAELLEHYLNQQSEIKLNIFSATDPLLFLEQAQKMHPQLVFLDVDMAVMNGIVLGEKIKETGADTLIIYITAYENYALEAFRVRAFHYLIKPVSQEQVAAMLQEALTSIANTGGAEPEKAFALQRRGETITLPMGSIVCFEKVGHKIRVHAGNAIEEYYGNFAQLKLQISQSDFVQCHQGYFVNVSLIRSFRDKMLNLDGGLQIPVSRTFAEPVRIALAKRLFGGKGGAR